MPKILIVGYPKSGTTYASRLVANVLRSPLVGYWGSDHKEIARTGLDRIGPFRCYKGHHAYTEIKDGSIDKIIYVVRDPRAVAVSAAHYFAEPFVRSGGIVASILHKAHWNIIGKRKALKRATKAMLHGDASFNQHMALDWKTYHTAYASNNVYTLRYEDALEDPYSICESILDLVNVSEDPDFIERAIAESGFDAMLKEFKSSNNKEGLFLLRNGVKDAWKKELPKDLQHEITKALESELKDLGYPTKV